MRSLRADAARSVAIPEKVTRLPARPLGERVARELDRQRAWHDDPLARLTERCGVEQRIVYAWQHERQTVSVVDAYEVLDALDLQLIDVYTAEQLAVLPSVVID